MNSAKGDLQNGGPDSAPRVGVARSRASSAVTQPPSSADMPLVLTNMSRALEPEKLPEQAVAALSIKLDNFIVLVEHKLAELSSKLDKDYGADKESRLEQVLAERVFRLDRHVRHKSGQEVPQESAEPLGQVHESQQLNEQRGWLLQGSPSKAEIEGETSALKAQMEFWRAQASQSSKVLAVKEAQLSNQQARAVEFQRQLEEMREALRAVLQLEETRAMSQQQQQQERKNEEI
eukprot:jgi/Mesvir1/13153/Mv06122-RA.1